MTDHTIAARLESLAGQVGDLRRGNRTLKVTTLAALILAGVALALRPPTSRLEAAPPDQPKDMTVARLIVTRSIAIRDATGKDRLIMIGGNDPQLSMFDANGKERFILTLIDGAPCQMFGQKDGDARLQIGLQSWDNTPHIDTFDAKGNAIELLDKAGKLKVTPR